MSDQPVVLQTMEMPPRIAETMGGRYRVLHLWQAEDQPAFVAEHGQDVQAILTMGHGVADAPLIDALPNLGVMVFQESDPVAGGDGGQLDPPVGDSG